jgi:Mn-dependent DtxR family transcriptional regulator
MWKIRSQFREQLEYQRLLREMYTATEAGTHPIAFVELLNRRSWSEDELQTTVRELRSEGLIKAGPHDRLALTDSGLHQAAVVTRGYRLWKLYMMRHAEIAGDFLDLDAGSIDRIVAPETISKLESILNEQGRLPVIPRPGASS